MDIGLKEFAEDGFIRFSIKAKDTKENQAVHDAFKAFCAAECDNNYTQGIRRLLEVYEDDYHMETLWNAVHDTNARIDEIENKMKNPTPTEPGMF